MAEVPTVNGQVDSADLGRVLVHEHVVEVDDEYRLNYDPDWDEDAAVAECVTALRDAKAAGIDTILDPTVLGLGRHIPRIQLIAAQVDVNIVVATGAYTFHDAPIQVAYRGPGLLFDEPEPLDELFRRDLEHGIAHTGVRAAFLKCAIDEPGLTPGVERVMRSVGRVSAATGAPITVHTNPHHETGTIAQRVLEEEGVDLRKVILGHSGDSTDLDHLMAMADRGSMLGMDRFGLDVFLPFEDRIRTIVELVARGYADRLVVSHDQTCRLDWATPARVRSVLPRWNLRLVSDEVVPALRAAGVGEDDLDAILVRNPRRHFEL
jgi:phosphotriesterase-related protein